MQMSLERLQQCWFLAGPTACGKSQLALELAPRINAELISMDSMAIYRGMDIGTAKPSIADQARAVHHLIDVIDPSQEFSVAEYVQAAIGCVDDILDRDRTPVFVGGTGLYLRSLLRGVFEGPPADPQVRGHLEREIERNGPQALHDQLRQKDSVTAERLHPNDTRRVVRALEVFELTGQPLSAQQQQPPRLTETHAAHIYWLSPPRDWLYERINRRVDQMLAAGLLDEVRRLIERPEGLSQTARQALGYKELIEFLNNDRPWDAAVDMIKTRTRQFAKRQHTWFRNLEECCELPIQDGESSEQIVVRMLAESHDN